MKTVEDSKMKFLSNRKSIWPNFSALDVQNLTFIRKQALSAKVG